VCQSINQEEFNHFRYQYEQYKERLVDNADSPAKLLKCLGPDMSKMLYSSLGAELKNLNELNIFENIIACYMTKQTVQARTTELHRIRQEPGQPVQSFLANLKSKARQCERKLTFSNLTCQTELNYSEPVILGLFINGVSDMELQQDLLAEQNMTLTKAISQALARETAKRSSTPTSRWCMWSPRTRKASTKSSCRLTAAATNDTVIGRIAQLKTICAAAESRGISESIATETARK
jgi:hypothetical protein